MGPSVSAMIRQARLRRGKQDSRLRLGIQRFSVKIVWGLARAWDSTVLIAVWLLESGDDVPSAKPRSQRLPPLVTDCSAGGWR